MRVASARKVSSRAGFGTTRRCRSGGSGGRSLGVRRLMRLSPAVAGPRGAGGRCFSCEEEDSELAGEDAGGVEADALVGHLVTFWQSAGVRRR